MSGRCAGRRRWLAGLLIALAGCAQQPQEARPALWRVEDAQGQAGWLFGTIHAAPRPVQWETPEIGRALSQADEIVVEVGNLADEREVSATFSSLARSAAQPPLSQRLAPGDRPALAALLKKAGYREGDFTAMDTWAAALTLANAGEDRDAARNGIDRAVLEKASGRKVIELEGAKEQLGLFDALPEREQRDLLREVAREAAQEDRDITETWRLGDMAAIEKETRSGLLADPELREVLFTGRNRRWTGRIAQEVRAGHKPFVAVGAAHMAGPEGLPAMLAKAGFKVIRVQ